MNKLSKKLAVAFTGSSNSGKTTLVVKVAEHLNKAGYKVCTIKHDPKDKAIFDVEGKDSHKMFQSGADVAVVSPTRTTTFSHSKTELEDVVKIFDDFDYLLVEGLKHLPLPRIAVVREKFDESYLEYADIIATDMELGFDTLDLNSVENIIEWIDQNGLYIQ
jgi:molybdopterin-guanine dinucleotide biosynthesis protein B